MNLKAENIIEICMMHPLKVKNIYSYGSHVYGTNTPNSDRDYILVGSALNEHSEIKTRFNDELINIHIITPDKFKRDLVMHEMTNIECHFLDDSFILQKKEDYPLEYSEKRLIKTTINNSYNNWNGGKHKLNRGDIHRGLKSIFHSLRKLMFAIQIKEHGKIVDYSEANYLFHEIMDSDEIAWFYFKEKYLPFKVELEKKLKK